MPRGDKTGPNGLGKMTGRRAGYCAGYNTAGYENEEFVNMGAGNGFRQGSGFGRRSRHFGGGYGNGRGMGYRYFAERDTTDNSNIEKRISILESKIDSLISGLKNK